MADAPEDKPKATRAGARLRHDLRTPINQIIGYSEMRDEDAAEAANAPASEDLRRIAAAARSMLDLVDRIPDELASAPTVAAAAAPAAGETPEKAPGAPAAAPARRPAAPVLPVD